MSHTPPSEAINDEPTVCVEINAQWVSWVMARLQPLTQEWFWSGDEETVYDATQEAEKLMLALALGSEACMTPIGSIVAWPSATLPDGWLLCDGQYVSISSYPALFDLLGETYGLVLEGTTFKLPNLSGSFPLGVDGSHALASAGGAATVTLTTSQIPPHTHDILTRSSATAFGTATRLARPSGTGSADTLATESTGGSGSPAATQPHNNMPPYLALNYIIRAE